MDGGRNFNKISLGAIKCVAEIMRRKSIKEAARFLNISQPAASQHLKRFEEAIGYSVVFSVGNEIVVRGSDTFDIINDIERSASELYSVGVRGRGRKWKPSLGISSDFIEFVARDLESVSRLSRQYNISILSPEDVYRRFKNGDLDSAFGVFPRGDVDSEFLISLSCIFMGNKSVNNVSNEKSHLISGPRGSIWDSYVQEFLRRLNKDCLVTIRAENLIYAMRLSALGMGLTPVIGIHDGIARELGIAKCGEISHYFEVECGLLFHSKAIAARSARGIFEHIKREVVMGGSG